MVLKKEIALQIKDLLKKNPQGLSITDIVKGVKINRNTAGRYLENLLVSGQVEMRRFGMAKIYMIAQRVPLSAVLSLSSELVVQLDTHLRIIFANEPFLNLIGSDVNALLGKNIEYTPVALVFDEAFTGFIENVKEGIRGREWAGEIALSTKDIILFCRIAPTVFEDGRKGVSVILEDITENKKAEKELQQSEDRYRSLVEISPDAVIIHQEGKIIFMNNAALKMIGASHTEEIIGKNVLDFIQSEFRDSVRKNIQKDLSGYTSPPIELQMLRLDGTSILVEGRGVKTTIGGMPAIQVALRDITERKRMEEEIRIAEETYRNIFINSQIGLFRTNIHTGLIIDANNAVARFIGYQDRSSLLAEPFNIAERYVDPHDREEILSLLETQGEFQNYEARFRKNDGSIVWMRFSGKLVREKGWLEGISEEITESKRTEMALHESEGKLNAMLQSITDPMSMMDENLTILWANESAKRYFGKNIVGKKCYEAYHMRRDSCEPYPCLTLKSFRDGKMHQHETIVIDSQGESRFFECSANVALRDSSGKPVAVLEISRDITDKKRAELALRDSEERLRLLIDSTEDLVFMQDPEGRYLYFNATALYGVSEEKMLGSTPYDLLDKDVADRIVERVKNVVKTGQIIKEETQFVWKGQTLWFSDSLSPVMDANGTITAVVTVSHNITDSKRADMVLSESEKKYRTLVTATGDIIWETDDQAHFVFVSPQVESIVGYKPDELIGHSPFEFLKPDAVEQNQKRFRTAIENKEKSIIYISHWIHKDGHSVYLESHAVPIYRSDGSFSGFIGIDRKKTL